MKNKKEVSYAIIFSSVLFILLYAGDGIREFHISYQGLGFPYKPISFYILKLLYACLFLFGGIGLLLNKERYYYPALLFSSVGMLISILFFYIFGFVFRIIGIDRYFLEIVSFFIIIYIHCEIIKNKYVKINWLLIIGVIGLNLLLNYISYCFNK